MPSRTARRAGAALLSALGMLGVIACGEILGDPTADASDGGANGASASQSGAADGSPTDASTDGKPASNADGSFGGDASTPAPEDAGCVRGNGLGDTYTSCEPRGTQTREQALLACGAFKLSHPAVVDCADVETGSCAGKAIAAFDAGSNALASWAFDGPRKGNVAQDTDCPDYVTLAWGF